jgi:hypothetical protein
MRRFFIRQAGWQQLTRLIQVVEQLKDPVLQSRGSGVRRASQFLIDDTSINTLAFELMRKGQTDRLGVDIQLFRYVRFVAILLSNK